MLKFDAADVVIWCCWCWKFIWGCWNLVLLMLRCNPWDSEIQRCWCGNSVLRILKLDVMQKFSAADAEIRCCGYLNQIKSDPRNLKPGSLRNLKKIITSCAGFEPKYTTTFNSRVGWSGFGLFPAVQYQQVELDYDFPKNWCWPISIKGLTLLSYHFQKSNLKMFKFKLQ